MSAERSRRCVGITVKTACAFAYQRMKTRRGETENLLQVVEDGLYVVIVLQRVEKLLHLFRLQVG